MLAQRLYDRRTYMAAIALAVLATFAISFAVSRGGSDEDHGGSSEGHGMVVVEQRETAMDRLTGDAFVRPFPGNRIMERSFFLGSAAVAYTGSAHGLLQRSAAGAGLPWLGL